MKKQAVRRADQPSGLNTSRVGVSNKFEEGKSEKRKKIGRRHKIAVVRVANSQKNDVFSAQSHSPDGRTGHRDALDVGVEHLLVLVVQGVALACLVRRSHYLQQVAVREIGEIGGRGLAAG